MKASHCSTVCDSHQHPQRLLHILPSWAPFIDRPAPSRLMRMPLCIFTLSHPPHFLPPTSAPCSMYCAILGTGSTDLLHQSDCDHHATEIFNQAPGVHGKSACCRNPLSMFACLCFLHIHKIHGWVCTALQPGHYQSPACSWGCRHSWLVKSEPTLLTARPPREESCSWSREIPVDEITAGSCCRNAPGCKRLRVCPHHCGAPVRGAAGTCPQGMGPPHPPLPPQITCFFFPAICFPAT